MRLDNGLGACPFAFIETYEGFARLLHVVV